MSIKYIIKELKDEKKVDKEDPFFENIDISLEDNFDFKYYNGELYTGGCVGIGRLYDRNKNVLTLNGKEEIVVIKSSYKMNPWKMLEEVMTDEAEYDLYINELKKNKKEKFLFKILYNQPIIKLEQDSEYAKDEWNPSVLYAISFANACYDLCKRGIRKDLIYHEENINSKIKGRINIKKNIRKNTIKGRNDRFYCKYIDFTSDVIENRILKAALIRCKETIELKFKKDSNIMEKYYFCMNHLRKVKTVSISKKDFSKAKITGLYEYYRPLIKQANNILFQKYNKFLSENGKTISKSVFTVPYMINMEILFELYVRKVIRDSILKDDRFKDRYEIESYSEKIYTENGITQEEKTLKNIHLIPYEIPDIIIRDKVTGEAVSVFDAKYKNNDRSSRSDSHQLLSYVLLTGVNKCGFIFPGEETQIEMLRDEESMEITTPLINRLQYYEIKLGNYISEKEVNIINEVIIKKELDDV